MGRFESLNQDEEFARRINHETCRIESVCLHCYATVTTDSDTRIIAIHEKAHLCLQKEHSLKKQNPQPGAIARGNDGQDGSRGGSTI